MPAFCCFVFLKPSSCWFPFRIENRHMLSCCWFRSNLEITVVTSSPGVKNSSFIVLYTSFFQYSKKADFQQVKMFLKNASSLYCFNHSHLSMRGKTLSLQQKQAFISLFWYITEAALPPPPTSPNFGDAMYLSTHSTRQLTKTAYCSLLSGIRLRYT